MKCQLCNAVAAAGSVFCPKCGAKLVEADFDSPQAAADVASVEKGNAPPASTSTASYSTSGSRTRDVPEETLWEGTYSPKAMLGTLILAGLASVGLLVVALLFSTSTALTWILLAAILLIWLAASWRLAVNRLGRSYRLTNQMFYHREGVLTRTIDRIELIEIHDVTWRQGLAERLVDVGTVLITSADRTHGKLALRGIERVESVANQIDKARRGEQIRRGRRIDFSSIDGQT